VTAVGKEGSSCDVSNPRWLLLAHQLPTNRSNARVKTWRRLQQLGAVPARSSVYVLPNTDQSREDFEWLRTEIVALGGEATVFAADAISDGGAEEIVAVFQKSRAEDYRALQKDVRRLLSSTTRKRRSGEQRPRLSRAVRALRDRFDALERIDFFGAAARDETAAALAELETAVDDPRKARTTSSADVRRADFIGRRWVTRRRPGVDRMSSAWLIRRYIDPKATFAFVDTPLDSDVAFDMYAGGFGHRGGLCTFEVLREEFAIDDDVVGRIGRIVHDLDLKEHKYGAPEAEVIGRMVEGLRALHADDATLLEHGMEMFEALARSFGER
jgi:hypothetical protein